MEYQEMTQDQKFISDVVYFIQEKGDAERFLGYDDDRLKKLNPILHNARNQYKIAQETLNIVCNSIK